VKESDRRNEVAHEEVSTLSFGSPLCIDLICDRWRVLQLQYLLWSLAYNTFTAHAEHLFPF
jgi:hypothetical protein